LFFSVSRRFVRLSVCLSVRPFVPHRTQYCYIQKLAIARKQSLPVDGGRGRAVNVALVFFSVNKVDARIFAVNISEVTKKKLIATI
jgi:hypothetical protein